MNRGVYMGTSWDSNGQKKDGRTFKVGKLISLKFRDPDGTPFYPLEFPLKPTVRPAP